MNLLLTIPHFRASTGGAEAFAVLLMGRLAARGHRITVLAADGEPLAGVDLRCGSLASAPEVKAAVFPDLVIDWGLNVPADVHRLGGGTHREFQRIVLESYPWPVALAKGWLYRLSRRHRRIAAAEAALLAAPGTHVIAVSRFVRDQVRRTVALAPERVHVLHNGVDSTRFHPGWSAAARVETRERLGLAAGQVAFLLVGHNLRLKNSALIAAIFSRIHAQVPEARFVVLGRRDPGIRAPWAVHVPGTARAEAIYGAMDVLVHPTYYDACANVVLEALASGLPVISSDRNGSAELLQHGHTGYVLPVVGPRARIRDAWSKTLLDLAQDVALRQRLSVAARQCAEEHDIDRYVDAFERCLERIAVSHRAAPGAHSSNQAS